MTGPSAQLATYGFAFALLLHAAFAWHLGRSGYAGPSQGRAAPLFMGAVAFTAAWAAAALAEPHSRLQAPVYIAAALDLARYALWFGFLLMLLRPGQHEPPAGETRWLGPLPVLLIAAGAVTLAWRAATGQYQGDESRAAIGVALALPLLGMVLVEQLFRNLPEDSRWNAKPLCLGLAVVFVFDIYLFAEAVLFGRLDADAQSIRGAVHGLAVPLLYLASRRRVGWIGLLQVSRTAAFHSATLLLAGGYLLFMSAVGYYVRFTGGDWGRALQIGLFVAALVLFLMVMLSGSLRARLRVFVGKNFFSYRYDYRQEWLRFTAMLSSRGSPQEVGGLVVRGLADMVESPAGSLWSAGASPGTFRQNARWNLPAVDALEPADSALCAFLRDKGWVVDVDEFRDSPRRYGTLALPAWLLATPNLWLVVPLQVDDELLGFVTLARPRTPVELDWEVRDLLKTAGRQAAGYLAQMQATEALLEARKFEAFNRMSAFVVHDLKNIVTQLSLMMKNAQRLHANPEFQQDMLLTVESSLEKMRRLMLQLREGATPPGGAHGVELAAMLARMAAMAEGRGRHIDIEASAGLATRGHEDRLERVLGHLVHNALDATAPGDRVWIKARRHSGQVVVEVGDSGAGMSEDFVQNQLFRPFSTTKHSGMGIGSYEALQYVRELGGSIEVESAVGSGTVMTVRLPVFEVHSGSDLHRSEARP